MVIDSISASDLQPVTAIIVMYFYSWRQNVTVQFCHLVASSFKPFFQAACGLQRLRLSETDLAAPLRLLHDFGAIQDNDEGSPGGSERSSDRRATSTSPLHAAAPRIQPRVTTQGAIIALQKFGYATVGA